MDNAAARSSRISSKAREMTPLTTAFVGAILPTPHQTTKTASRPKKTCICCKAYKLLRVDNEIELTSGAAGRENLVAHTSDGQPPSGVPPLAAPAGKINTMSFNSYSVGDKVVCVESAVHIKPRQIYCVRAVVTDEDDEIYGSIRLTGIFLPTRPDGREGFYSTACFCPLAKVQENNRLRKAEYHQEHSFSVKKRKMKSGARHQARRKNV